MKPLKLFYVVVIAFFSVLYGQVEPPSAPTNLSAIAVAPDFGLFPQSLQINLSWTASSGAIDYNIYRGGSYIGSTTSTSYSDTSLSCGTLYLYTVRAYNAGGESGNSNAASATTDECKPGVPSNVIGSGTGPTTATVSWIRNSPYTETGFDVHLYNYTDSTHTYVNPAVGSGATSVSVTGLLCGKTYQARVRAYVTTNGRTYPPRDTESGYSTFSSPFTTSACTPEAPNNLDVAYSRDGAMLQWNDNSDNEEGFWILKIMERDSAPSMRGWIQTSVNQTEYLDTAVQLGAKYSYRVFAFNSVGMSDPSNVAKYQHFPSIPMRLQIYDGANIRVDVDWDNDWPKYKELVLYWSNDSYGSGFYQVDNLDIETRTTNFIGLCGANRFYVVALFDIDELVIESLPSAVDSVTITDPVICGISGVDSTELDNEFSLAQNYPNPFNLTTEISFNLPDAAPVSLKVFDILGREVVNLVDGFQEAGSHKIAFNASDLPSGVYIYRLQSGNFVDIKKMILTK